MDLLTHFVARPPPFSFDNQRYGEIEVATAAGRRKSVGFGI